MHPHQCGLKLYKCKLTASIHPFACGIMFGLSLVQCLSVNLTWSDCLCLCSVLLVTVTMSFSPDLSGPLGCTSIQEQRDGWERKRSRTARELVQTEQHYCQQLELVTTVRTVTVRSTGLTRWRHKEVTPSEIKASKVSVPEVQH